MILAERKSVCRVEARFKLALEELKLEQLTVRQTGESEFIILADDPSDAVEFILATRRIPDEPRTFNNLGRCVQAAVRMFGLNTIHFDLIEDASVRADEG